MVVIVPKNMDEISSVLRLNLFRKKLPAKDQKMAEHMNKSWLIKLPPKEELGRYRISKKNHASVPEFRTMTAANFLEDILMSLVRNPRFKNSPHSFLF